MRWSILSATLLLVVAVECSEARQRRKFLFFPLNNNNNNNPGTSFAIIETALLLSRGGAEDGDDADDDHRRRRAADPLDRPPARNVPLPRRPPSRKKKKSTLSSIAGKSVQLTSGLITSSLVQSGKAAYYLVQPKHVERKELFGLWRLDQQLEQQTSVVNLQLTPRDVIVSGVHGVGDDERAPPAAAPSPWKFTPAKWPARAKVEFVVVARGGQQLLYKAVVHRKLAAKSVLKLKGKIYRLQPTGWRGKSVRPVLAGTFVARRRLQLEEEDDDDDDEEEEIGAEEDNKEHRDADDEKRASNDVNNDAEEENDGYLYDWNEGTDYNDDE